MQISPQTLVWGFLFLHPSISITNDAFSIIFVESESKIFLKKNLFKPPISHSPNFLVNLGMRKAFQKALLEAKALSPQEQLALIATLSQLLSQKNVFPGTTPLSPESIFSLEDDVEILRRVKDYEEGKSKTISGKTFREKLKKKYGA